MPRPPQLCRYLVAAPPHPLERAHSVRVAIGNGLRPDVWRPFRERFGIPVITEFYASTEGNGMTMVRQGGGGDKEGVRRPVCPWYVARVTAVAAPCVPPSALPPSTLQRATSPADDGAVGRFGLLARLSRPPPFIAQVGGRIAPSAPGQASASASPSLPPSAVRRGDGQPAAGSGRPVRPLSLWCPGRAAAAALHGVRPPGPIVLQWVQRQSRGARALLRILILLYLHRFYRRRMTARSCETCDIVATSFSARAISSRRTRTGGTILSTASETPFAGRAKTSQRLR